MIVVGLSGYAGAGKDAVADILVRDYGFTKMAFADPLKRMLRRLDPIIGHELYAGCCDDCGDIPEVEEVRFSDAAKFGFDDQSLKYSPWAAEVRELWQRFGTEVFREEDDDYWIQRAWHDIPGEADRVVFTDVRFENEAEWITDRLQNPRNSLWRVVRPDQYPDTVHESEQMVGLLGEEVTILNDGSLEDLEHPVALAMARLLEPAPEQTPGQMALDFDWWKWTK